MAGTIGDIAASITKAYAAVGTDEIFVIFDYYSDAPIAKDHERRRRAGVETTEYKLTINTPLPRREAVMKSTSNKKQLARLLCTYDFNANKILLVNNMDCITNHEEADIILISYMLQAAGAGAPTIRILSEDTDVCPASVHGLESQRSICSADGEMGWHHLGHQCHCQGIGRQMPGSPGDACPIRM